MGVYKLLWPTGVARVRLGTETFAVRSRGRIADILWDMIVGVRVFGELCGEEG
jgi:hypothetical protein